MKVSPISIIFWTFATSIVQSQSIGVWECEYENESQTNKFGKESLSRSSCYLTSYDRITSDMERRSIQMSSEDVKFIRIFKKFNKLSSKMCEEFNMVESIVIENVNISAIEENSLEFCSDLKIFDAANSKIREVPQNLLSKNSKLTEFKIIRNKLTSLPDHFFQNQQQLIFLSLARNKINFLPSTIFHPLLELQHLDLHVNNLQFLNPKWFVNLRKLIILDLRAVGLSELPSGVFDSLESLETLNLSFNELTTISIESFRINDFQIKIDLRNNKVTEIDENLLKYTAVKHIDMRNNSCRSEDIKTRNSIEGNLRLCFDNFELRLHIQTASPESTTTVASTSQSTYQNDFEYVTEKILENNSNSCGKVQMDNKVKIIGGAHISHGDYPWIAALETIEGQFFCGGTIVTSRKVVTAAHCIRQKMTSVSLEPQEFLVLLGAYDLNARREVGRIVTIVKDIHIHPDWNSFTKNYDADITVLVLEQEVTFGRFIQPICLIDSISITSSVDHGTVVGFGRSEDMTKLHENIAKSLDMPIQDNVHCLLHKYGLSTISSGRTFCGGHGNGTGVCVGDSGSGMYVLYEGVYYFRGIVSTSLKGSTYGCDVNSYEIFTDMLKFNDWISRI